MVELQQWTGDARIDALVSGIVTIIELTFPDRVRGYYLVGSYGETNAIALSDVDLEILFRDTLTSEERVRLLLLRDAIRSIAPIHVDLAIKDEAALSTSDTVALKRASLFLYGQDTRDVIPLPTMEVYLQHISGPTHRGLTQRFHTPPIVFPLTYPDPADEFYGYIPERFKGVHGDIKAWVLHVGWLATFLIVYRIGVYVPSKSQMLPLYRQHIHDEWLPFVEAVFQNGRERWGYNLPTSVEDRALLRDLCGQTLAFENHAANAYLAYLRRERDSGDRAFAMERLRDFEVD